MATEANTILFNTRNANGYYKPLAGFGSIPYYLFAAKDTAYANDAAPPAISDTVSFVDYQIYDEMIFGKRITEDDVAVMTNRYDWTIGQIYDYYDDQDPDLASKRFFVVSPEAGSYHVFKCLNNNGGIASQYAPLLSQTSATDFQYFTADGYHWKYLYTISNANFLKFSTTSHMPVFLDTSIANSAISGAIDTIVVESPGSRYYSYASGQFEEIAVGSNTQVHGIQSDSMTLSSNTNFYTGCSLYISSGTGAGQIRTIQSYTITPTQKLVGISSAFDTSPDLTSEFEITPTVSIVGDGTGATAIASVNTSTLGIQSVQVISEGTGYTTANVTITGNTGSVTQANSAVAVAIIPPKNGHGSDVYTELFSDKVGISVAFSNTNSIIPKNSQYRRIGVFGNPIYDGVVVNYTNATASFLTGETIIQQRQSSVDLSSYEAPRYEYSNKWRTATFKTLQFSSNVSFPLYHALTGNTGNGVVTEIVSANTVKFRIDAGTVTVGNVMKQVGNNLVNATVSVIGNAFSTSILSSLDSSNSLFTYESGIDTIKVFNANTEIFSTAIAANGDAQYSVNSTAVQLFNVDLANTTIFVDRYRANVEFATVISNTAQFTSGTVVSTNSTALVLDDVDGLFYANTVIFGQDSFASANVTSIVGQDDTFDQRTKIIGTYEIGSNNFVRGDVIYQYESNTSNTIVGTGTVQSLDTQGANTIVNLTLVKGDFVATSNTANKYIKTANSLKNLKVLSITESNIRRYSGEIVYVENKTPITRANTQSETIRLVLSISS